MQYAIEPRLKTDTTKRSFKMPCLLSTRPPKKSSVFLLILKSIDGELVVIVMLGVFPTASICASVLRNNPSNFRSSQKKRLLSSYPSSFSKLLFDKWLQRRRDTHSFDTSNIDEILCNL